MKLKNLALNSWFVAAVIVLACTFVSVLVWPTYEGNVEPNTLVNTDSLTMIDIDGTLVEQDTLDTGDSLYFMQVLDSVEAK